MSTLFTIFTRAHQLRSDDSGAELVEFALTSGLLLALLLGSLEVSRALYAGHTVSSLARETSRYAMLRGSSAGSVACAGPAAANCQATAQSVAAFAVSRTTLQSDAAKLQVTATWLSVTATGAACAAHAPGCLVRVQVSYPFRFLFSFLPSATLPLTGSSTVTIQR